MAEYSFFSSYNNSDSTKKFFYQQREKSDGTLATASRGHCFIGFYRGSSFHFRSVITCSKSSNENGKALVVSEAKLQLSGASFRYNTNNATINIYITNSTSNPWNVGLSDSNTKLLASNILVKGGATINLNNDVLASFLQNNQSFRILLTLSNENATGQGVRYNSATFSFNWKYGASSGTITSDSPTIGKEITLEINPVDSTNSTYSHKVEWGIIDASENKILLQESEIPVGETSCFYTYKTSNYEYFGKTSKTASAYVNLKTYSDSTEMGNIPIPFTLNIGDDAKPTITSASFSPKNPSTRNDINISNAISGLYVQSLSQICWNAKCRVADGTEIEKYNLSYTGVITGAEELKNNSASQSDKLINKSLTKSGKVTGTLTVTDKRGFTSESISLPEITILSYNDISFSELSFRRVNRNTGDEDLITGTGIAGTAKVNFSSVNEKNGVKITYEIKQGTDTLKNKTTISGNSLSIQQTDYTISSAEAIITISAVDNFGSKIVDTIIKIPSSSYIMHFKESSLGIGSAAGDLNTLTIGWKTKFSDSIELVKGLSNALPLSSGGTESNSRSGAFNTIVAPGGDITGDLYLNNSYCYPQINFRPKNAIVNSDVASRMGTIYLFTGDGTGDANQKGPLTQNRFAFRQFGYDTTNNTLDVKRWDTFTLPNTTPDVSGENSYEIWTDKNYCYYPGDTITLSWAWGFVSNGIQDLFLYFPVQKSLKKVNGINSISALRGNIRHGGTYWISGSYSESGTEFLDYCTLESTFFNIEQSIIAIALTCPTNKQGVKNHVAEFDGTFTLTFK